MNVKEDRSYPPSLLGGGRRAVFFSPVRSDGLVSPPGKEHRLNALSFFLLLNFIEGVVPAPSFPSPLFFL